MKLDTRQQARILPTRPIVFVMALLAVLALALTAWYSLGSSANRVQSVAPDRTYANGGPYDNRVHGTDPYSPRDPIEQPQATPGNTDPYSPHDPMS
jgi:hypothetical protein